MPSIAVVRPIRYLTDADKYQMIDTADNSTEYYYEQQVGNYYVLYKYTRDGSYMAST